MTTTFFYMQGGQRIGPVSDSQLRKLLSSGQVQSEDLVWQQGMANWLPASQVPGLLAPQAATGASDAQGKSSSPATPSVPPAPSTLAPTKPAVSVPVRLLVIVGGGCLATGVILGILIGLLFGWLVFAGRSGPGSVLGSAQNPAKLVGHWEGTIVGSKLLLELKANGSYAYSLPDTVVAKEWRGSWKVDSVVDGKYKIHIKKDEEPDRIFGWVITVLDDNRIHLEGHDIGDIPTTLTRKK